MTTILAILATITGVQWTVRQAKSLFWIIVILCVLFMTAGCAGTNSFHRFAGSLEPATKTASAQLFPRIYYNRPAQNTPICPPTERNYTTNHNYPLSLNRPDQSTSNVQNSTPPDRKDYLLFALIAGMGFLALRQHQWRRPEVATEDGLNARDHKLAKAIAEAIKKQ